MEVDLRSREKSQRTLHWFVRGNQQKRYIYGVPDRVEFGVCFFLLVVSSFHFFHQISTCYQNERIDFIRLEELRMPSVVRGMEGERGIEW